MGLVTYDTTTAGSEVVGVRLLKANEYVNQNFGLDANVMGTASTTIGSGGTTTIHSLTLANGSAGITDTVNGTLKLDSGAIVSGTNTGGAANTITGGTIVLWGELDHYSVGNYMVRRQHFHLRGLYPHAEPPYDQLGDPRL